MLGLYSWGANSHGQLGLGYSCEMVWEPVRVDELPAQLSESNISSIVGGGGHTLLLSNTGGLYGTGWNNCGQIGDGTASRCVPCFRECRGLEGSVIVEAACGWAHSVACSDTGQVWVWGSNSHGQLGLPTDEVPFSSLPICLELPEVVSVSAGLRHTAVATRSGDVYTWGHGQRGQLGHVNDDGTTTRVHPTPRLLDTLETKVCRVSCGQNTTYALTCDGTVLAWGDNKWGQLAHDPRNLLYFTCPLMIPSNYFGGEKVTWLQCGWTHTVGGTVSGAVYTWGRGDYGQLGPPPAKDEEDNTPLLGRPDAPSEAVAGDELTAAEDLPKYRYIPSLVSVCRGLRLEQLVCGSEHCVALLSRSALRRQSLPSLGRLTIPPIPNTSSSLGRNVTAPTAADAYHNKSSNSSNNSSCNSSPQLPGRGSTTSSTSLPSPSNDSRQKCLPSNNMITDSGTVSSASDSGSATRCSPVPVDDTVEDEEKQSIASHELLPALKNFKLTDFDEPCTLSPIDSPRSLVVQSSHNQHNDNRSNSASSVASKLPLDISKNNKIGDNQSQHRGSLSALPNRHIHSVHLSGVPLTACSLYREAMSSGGGNDSLLSLQPSSMQQEDEEDLSSSLSSVEFPCMYSWGWNEHGNCGVGTTENVIIPRRVPVEGKVLLVAAGSGHSFALIRSHNKVVL